MSIIALNAKNFDVVTLQMHPKRMFSSSSNGITGSIFVYAERSTSIKDQAHPTYSSSAGASGFNDSSLDEFRSVLWATASVAEEIMQDGNRNSHGVLLSDLGLSTTLFPSSSVQPMVSSGSLHDSFVHYLTGVNEVVQSPNLKKYVEILRFKPTNKFTSDTLRKTVVVNNLFKYYRVQYPQAQFSYTNYNAINFFTASSVSPNRALIYPSPSTTADPSVGTYAITGSFNISFYINPRYTTEGPELEYKAGTLMHMSSCYAVTLHTGSGLNMKGLPNTFRVALQLSSSADTKPSEIDLSIKNNSRSYPQDLIFVSDEHSLKLNHWHHVSINYMGKAAWAEGGTGSFWIDGVEQNKSMFSVPSSSFNEPFYTKFNPLFIGNYYDGQNSGATSDLRAFFNENAASTEGVQDWGVGVSSDPTATLLNHPLNAEFHDLRIYNRVNTTNEIITASIKGPSREVLDASIKFYLPPFFTKDSTSRKVLRTPFQSIKQKTEQPFNTWLSFDVDGKDINLQNFVRDHRHHTFPRLFHLTSSEISDTTKDWQTANRLLYEFGVQSSYVRARNLTIVPCDNGLFSPSFDLLMTASDPNGVTSILGSAPASGSFISSYVDDLGLSNLSLITLRDMHKMPMLVTGTMQDDSDSSYVVQMTESGDWSSRSEPQILQLTRDNSSDEVVFFDSSNLFYGQSIKPGTYSLFDKAITGSNGKVSMRIVDDLRGNLYRADSATPPATWNSVGNVLYEEGISIIKSPNILFFGRDQFEVNLEGYQNVHSQEVNINANVGRINSSSNPTFHPMKPDNYANTDTDVFVAISEVLLHDNNLNVVGRAQLSQPVVKKITDKYLFRIKMDY